MSYSNYVNISLFTFHFHFSLGMAMGRVRDGFLYARIRPTGLPPLPESDPFNKRVFSGPKPASSGPASPA